MGRGWPSQLRAAWPEHRIMQAQAGLAGARSIVLMRVKEAGTEKVNGNQP